MSRVFSKIPDRLKLAGLNLNKKKVITLESSKNKRGTKIAFQRFFINFRISWTG